MSLNVLLVDGDADFAIALAGALRGDGHQVHLAVDGGSALVLARHLHPDVVLLDLRLPDADGYDVARSLRRDLPDTTPIIVITEQRDAILVEDVDLMLNKPVPSELFGGLIEYIRRHRRNRIAGRPRR